MTSLLASPAAFSTVIRGAGNGTLAIFCFVGVKGLAMFLYLLNLHGALDKLGGCLYVGLSHMELKFGAHIVVQLVDFLVA